MRPSTWSWYSWWWWHYWLFQKWQWLARHWLMHYPWAKINYPRWTITIYISIFRWNPHFIKFSLMSLLWCLIYQLTTRLIKWDLLRLPHLHGRERKDKCTVLQKVYLCKCVKFLPNRYQLCLWGLHRQYYWTKQACQ